MKPSCSTAGSCSPLPELEVTPWGYLGTAVRMLLLPLPWVGASYLAALIHELGHLLLLWAYGVPVWKIRIGAGGAQIHTTPLSPHQELVCALAGPLFGLILCLYWQWMPRTALCAVIQSLFNLLPIPGLDGHRALHALAHLRLPSRSKEKPVANQ